MCKWLLTLSITLILLCTACAAVEPTSKLKGQARDPSVKELISRYIKFSNAVRKGEMASFRALSAPEVNALVSADINATQLKAMADIVAPHLAGYEFLQMEVQGVEASLTYGRQSKQGQSYLVLKFKKDAGGWKVDRSHRHGKI